MFFVRTASLQDMPRVSDIVNDTFYRTNKEIYGAERTREINHLRHSTENLTAQRDRINSEFLVGDNGEILGGMAFASQTEKVITLHQIYVHPKFQGGKTGLHLMIEIENSFLDAETIELEVESENTKAISFFEKFGFKTSDQISSIEESGQTISFNKMSKSIVYAED